MISKNREYRFKVNTALMATLASVNANNVNSLDICEAPYQGINERVLACPGGRIKIISAEYGRPDNDRDTCCANMRKCWVKPGDQCTADATEWVNMKCNGTLFKTIPVFKHFTLKANPSVLFLGI